MLSGVWLPAACLHAIFLASINNDKEVIMSNDHDEDSHTSPQHHDGNPADRILAALYRQGLEQSLSTGKTPEFIDDIPAASTFGKWWVHFHDAATSPGFVHWANSQNIDLELPLTVLPGFDQIAGTVDGELQTFWGPEQGDGWSLATAALMHAAQVVGAGWSEIEAPTSRSSAPLVAVANFYAEPKFPAAIEVVQTRISELQLNGNFNEIPAQDTKRTAASRSDDALDDARTELGDAQDRHGVLEKLQRFPSNGSRALDEYLQNTLLQVHPHGRYAQLDLAPGATAISLATFIERSGWRMPSHPDALANLIRVLSTPALPKARLGNLGGALSWPVPLDNYRQKAIYSHVFYNLGLKGLEDRFRKSGALGYLADEFQSPPKGPGKIAQFIEQIVDSPKARALGIALQKKMGAVTTGDNYQDWVLAVIALTLDQETLFHEQINHVAGFDLAARKFYGQPLANIRQGLMAHLIETGRTSAEMAPVGAHILLSISAPELLIDDIPQTLTFGSIGWASLKAAVARIEAQSPGASAQLSFAHVISRDANEPISAAEELIQSLALEPVLIEWGEINGLLPTTTAGSHLPSAIADVQKQMAQQREQLKTVSPALSAETPTQISIASSELHNAFGWHIPFDRQCITSRYATSDAHRLTPSLTTQPVGKYSVLDLYLSGRAADPVNWVSDDKEVPIAQMLKRLSSLPEPKALHATAFAQYRRAIESAYSILTRHLISQLPLQDRQNIEFGAIRIYVEGKVTRTTSNLRNYIHVEESAFPEQSMQERALLIRTEYNGELAFYQLSAQHGWIRKREELHNGFEEGVQDKWVDGPPLTFAKREFNRAILQLEPKTELDQGLQGARQALGDIPASFISDRTQYLADLLSKHTTEAFEFDNLLEASKAVTTFDQEEARKQLATEIFLGIIPGASAIRHLAQGKSMEALGDVIFDGVMYATTLGFGKAAGGLKGLKAVKSFGNALAKLIKRGAREIGDFSAEVAQAARQGAKAVKVQLRGNREVLELAKRVNVAEGTIKAGGHLDALKVTAQFDEVTGNWFLHDLHSGKPYGMPIDFVPDTISSSRLQQNLKILSAHPKSDAIGSICYTNAMMVGMAEKTISTSTLDAVVRATQEIRGTNYSSGFKRLMGITDDSPKKILDVGEVSESGFVNFRYGREGGNYFHTAYIHKSDAGELFFYHSNSMSLDVALLEKNSLPQVVGRSNVYPFDSIHQMKLQQWLDQDNLEYVFTKASVLQANARM